MKSLSQIIDSIKLLKKLYTDVDVASVLGIKAKTLTVVHTHKLGNSFGKITKTKGGPHAIFRTGNSKAMDSDIKRIRENKGQSKSAPI